VRFVAPTHTDAIDRTEPDSDAGGSSDNGATPSRARRITAWLVRIAALTVGLVLLYLSGSAAWDSLALGVRGEPHRATVLHVDRTSWARADGAEVAVEGFGGPVVTSVTTPRKELQVGDGVEVIVDPENPKRAALAGDGWPWRQVLIPLCALPLIVLLGLRYGRLPPRRSAGRLTAGLQ
jgi:hypothetical protein